MRFSKAFPAVAALAASAALAPTVYAQAGSVIRVGPGAVGGRGMGYALSLRPAAAIGVTTTSNATSRDTLGVLVSVVRTGGPADKAGIQEGDRIASINATSLRLAAADVGDPDMAGTMSRRLTRELDKLKPGDDVELKLYSNGQWKTAHVKTEDPDKVYRSEAQIELDDRPTLGLRMALTGSKRDSLGLFVMGVDDGGPAEKAGIDEGVRIAAINGVDVRTRDNDDDDSFFRTSTINRFQRELQKTKPGDEAELRVYSGGQYRNVKVKVGRIGDLPRANRRVTIIGGTPEMMMPFDMDAMAASGQALARAARAMDEAGVVQRARSLMPSLPGRVQW